MRKHARKNRTIAIVLGLMLTVSGFTACNNGKNGSTPNQSISGGNTNTGSDDGYSLPFGDGENDTLSVACLEGWYSSVSINDNLEIWQEIEKRTGVKIQWEASADYDTVMQPRIASGQDLPDIFLVPPTWGNSGVYKLAADGLIQPLDDLINRYAPDIKKILEEDSELKGLLTAPDGVIYTIADTPKYVNELVVPNALFIREDWLKKMSLETPVTIEDWYNVLKAFKAEDPNENGENDEIPLSGILLGQDRNLLNYFYGAFGLPAGGGTWWYDDDGQVSCIYTTEKYKAFITEMHRWYEEGLIDMELTRDEANFQAQCTTNTVGAFSHLAEREDQYNSMLHTSGFEEANHILVKHPTNEVPLKVVKRTPTWSHYAIPQSSNKAELAIKWINFVWGSEEGIDLTEWGIKGKTYEVEDGKKQYTDFVLNNPEGLDNYNALRSLGASNTILVRTPAETYEALNIGSNAIPYAKSLNLVEPFPQVMATLEEQEILDMYESDFDTYCDETLIKFLTGAESLETYQTFLNTLDNMGMEDLQQVKQDQFDRSGGGAE